MIVYGLVFWLVYYLWHLHRAEQKGANRVRLLCLKRLRLPHVLRNDSLQVVRPLSQRVYVLASDLAV